MGKIFINDIIKDNETIRHDYKSKSILLLIDKENVNKKFKRFDNDTFENYENIIKKIKKIIFFQK